MGMTEWFGDEKSKLRCKLGAELWRDRGGMGVPWRVAQGRGTASDAKIAVSLSPPARANPGTAGDQ